MQRTLYVLISTLCLAMLAGSPAEAQRESSKASPVATSPARQAQMDRDLLEVTIPQLEALYVSHKYTVTDVVQWYFARIRKYNGIYRAIQDVDVTGALARAAQEDAETAANASKRGPMWGVLIVTKARGGGCRWLLPQRLAVRSRDLSQAVEGRQPAWICLCL